MQKLVKTTKSTRPTKKAKPVKRIKPVMIYIGNLHYKIDEKQLTGIFRRFGRVGEVKVIRDPKTEKSKGIAFVEMLDAKEAQECIQSLDATVIDGRTVKLSIAIDRFAEEKTTKVVASKTKSKVKTKSSKEEIIAQIKKKRESGLSKLLAVKSKKS